MRRTIAMAAAAGLAAWAQGTRAQEEAAPPPWDIVVTATRMASDPLTTPYSVYRLGGEEMNTRRAVRTMPDALGAVPSAMVQKTSHGQGSPFLRGFTGFRTLMLIDGIRLNNAVFRDGPNQYGNTVDPLSLRDLEVVMGPSSVLYGSDAIGGTVNALPLEPPSADDPAWSGRAYYRHATAGHANVGRVEVGGRPDERTGFVAGLSLKRFGDVEGGRDVGRQRRTGYDEWDGDLVLKRQLGDRGELTLGHQSVRQNDAWRTHRTIYGIAWKGLEHGSDKVLSYDQARDLTWLRLGVSRPSAAVDDLRVTVYRHLQTEDEYGVKSDDSARERGFDVATWGASVQMESADTELGRWVWGADVSRDVVDSYSKRLRPDGSVSRRDLQGPVADDATYDTLAVYLQDKVPFVDGRLQVIPGVRYTCNRADANRVADPVTGDRISVEGDWDAFTGSFRANMALDTDEHAVLFGGVSQGFRAPNLSDLTRFDIARSGEVETPVTDLDPEQFVSFEAGLKVRTGRAGAQAAFYHTLIDDMIVRTPTGRTIDGMPEVTKKNAGEGWVHGVELSGSYRFLPDWTLRAMAAWMDGEVDTYPTADASKKRDDLGRLMPLTAEAALRCEPQGARWWGEVAVRAAEKADRLSLSDRSDTQRIPPGGTPGYAVASVRGGVRVAGDTAITLAVENLADEDYRIHGSGVNEPGRHVVLAVDARF